MLFLQGSWYTGKITAGEEKLLFRGKLNDLDINRPAEL